MNDYIYYYCTYPLVYKYTGGCRYLYKTNVVYKVTPKFMSNMAEEGKVILSPVEAIVQTRMFNKRRIIDLEKAINRYRAREDK